MKVIPGGIDEQDEDKDGGLQPGRDPESIDAAQAALNRMRDAAAARGEVRRAAPRAGKQRPKTAHAAAEKPGDSASSMPPDAIPWAGKGGGSPCCRTWLDLTRWRSDRSWPNGARWWARRSLHTAHPKASTDTTLHVRCDSTAWATQLRLLSISLLEKFRTELGDGVVTSIQVLGPAAPSWRKGGRTV